MSALLVLRCCMFRSEEHTSELQSRFGISYAVFCLKKKIDATRPRRVRRFLQVSTYEQWVAPTQPRRATPPNSSRAPATPLTGSTAFFLFFFNDTATTEIYTFPYTTLFRSHLHPGRAWHRSGDRLGPRSCLAFPHPRSEEHTSELQSRFGISYAVFCLTK